MQRAAGAAYDVRRAAASNIPPPVMEVTAEPVVEKPSPTRITKSNEGLETFRQRLMNPGFVVTKYNFKSVLGGKKPRILYLDESSTKLGWKAPTGSAVSKAEKKGEMFALVDVTEVRAVPLPVRASSPPTFIAPFLSSTHKLARVLRGAREFLTPFSLPLAWRGDVRVRVQVRAASDPDPNTEGDEEPKAGTPLLRGRCNINVAPRAFSIIMPDRTVDIEVESEEQALYMIKHLRVLVSEAKV